MLPRLVSIGFVSLTGCVVALLPLLNYSVGV